jgi:hypothetical protein
MTVSARRAAVSAAQIHRAIMGTLQFIVRVQLKERTQAGK